MCFGYELSAVGQLGEVSSSAISNILSYAGYENTMDMCIAACFFLLIIFGLIMGELEK